jgi:hypothetical protein
MTTQQRRVRGDWAARLVAACLVAAVGLGTVVTSASAGGGGYCTKVCQPQSGAGVLPAVGPASL